MKRFQPRPNRINHESCICSGGPTLSWGRDHHGIEPFKVKDLATIKEGKGVLLLAMIELFSDLQETELQPLVEKYLASIPKVDKPPVIDALDVTATPDDFPKSVVTEDHN